MNGLEGAGALARAAVARDRVRLLAWLGGIVLLVVVSAASTKGIYPTQADLDEAAAAARDNPAALAFNGPDQGLDTIGGQVAFQVGAFGLTLVGLMAILLVNRFTRVEEDSGRLELVRSMPVGRHAPLAAGIGVTAAALVVLGIAVTVSLLLVGLPAVGSGAFGASYLAFGLVFVGAAAAAAQVVENPRVVSGMAGAVLGTSFALRALGDAGSGAVSWASPMGWAQKVRPYAGEQWWPLVLCVAAGAALALGSVSLAAGRDFGAGVVPPRPGPARADPRLRSLLGLAVRLHRGAVAWWGGALLLVGLVYGTLADGIDDFVGDSDGLRDVLAASGGASLTDAYLSTSMLVLALTSSGVVLQILVRLRSEEAAQRAEALLSTGTSRQRWVVSNLAVAGAGGALGLVAGGLGLGASYAAIGGDGGEVPRLLGAAVAYLPAVALLAAVAVALFGVAPRWATAVWAALLGCVVVGMFGTLLGMPQLVRDLSPFEHVPTLPAESLHLLPLLVLTAVASGLVAAGLAAFRSRDLMGS